MMEMLLLKSQQPLRGCLFFAGEEPSEAWAKVKLQVHRAGGTQTLGKPDIFPAKSALYLALHSRTG